MPALLQLVALHPFGHQADHRLARRAEFGRVRLLDAAEVPRRLDHRHLHAEADAEIRDLALAREPRRADLALGAALAKAARHQNAVDMFEERRRVLVLEHLAFDPVEIDLDLVGDAAVRQRLDQRLIRILHAGIFADDGDGDVAFGIADALVDETPGRQIGLGRSLDAEGGEHFAVETAGVIGLGHRIDVVDVARLDHGAFAHVAEQRELAPLAVRDRPVGAAQAEYRAGCRWRAVRAPNAGSAWS